MIWAVKSSTYACNLVHTNCWRTRLEDHVGSPLLSSVASFIYPANPGDTAHARTFVNYSSAGSVQTEGGKRDVDSQAELTIGARSENNGCVGTSILTHLKSKRKKKMIGQNNRFNN